MSSYNTLLNKYNTLVAQCQSMQETMRTKEEQWANRATEFKVVEDNARELCKLILAKDKSQINLGTDKGSWGSLSIRDLISQATQSYKKYNKERALALQQILDMAEERQEKIITLMDDLEFYKNNSNATEEAYEAEKKKKAEEKAINDALNQADYETQNNIQKNNVNISIVDDSSSINDSVADMLNELDTFQPMEQSIPVKNTNGKIKLAKEKQHQKKVVKEFSEKINFGQMVEDLSDIQKDYITIIGEQGLSKQNEITKVIKLMDKYSNRKESGLASAIFTASKEMQAMGIITAEDVSIPLQGESRMKIIRLTELGSRLYHMMTNKKCVLAEANFLMMEHDNIHHGYGIKAIYQGIEDSKNYKKATMDCRKEPLVVNPEKNKNVTYIPDIFAIYKDGQKCYFEYERGFTSRDDIIKKCNKMVNFTRNLYFLTDNKDHVDKLLGDLQAWKQEVSKRGLKCKVYLSTARYFQTNNFDVREKWMYILPELGSMPIEDDKL